ncbi:hypothetical protein EMCRGX_G033084 [Ephydatia muelleri]
MDESDDQNDVPKPDHDAAMRYNGVTRSTCCMPRIIGSKPVIAILLINVLLDGSYYSALSTLLNVFGGTAFKVVGLTFFVTIVLPLASPLLFYPLAGLVADACWGRHRTIQLSLWLVAVGQGIVFVTFLLLPTFQDAPVVEQVNVYVKVAVALVYVCVSIGFAGLQTNVIPFCMDQMAYASGDQLSALIHWYYWTSNVKSVLVVFFDCLSAQGDLQYYTVQFGINACLLGLALLIWHAWRPKFSIEPRGKNPVGTVCGVLTFASRHKYPRFQSSLTSERPSRLELCKSGYGGPFTTEEVEDVKSFFRVTVVLLSLGTFVLVDYAVGSSFGDHIQDRKLVSGSRCSLNTLLSNIWEIAPIILGIPLYEFIIRPLLCRAAPSTLQAMGIGMLMAVASMVSFMSIDVAGHYLDDNVTCFLNVSVSPRGLAGDQLPVSSYLLTLPFLLGTLADVFTNIAAYQFICAQAPYNMRGMLFGVFYSITGLFALLSGIFDLSIMYFYKYLTPSCGTIYYASMTLIGVMGFVTFVLVATKYRRRDRLDQGGQITAAATELSVN